MQPVHYSQAVDVNAGTITTASGQFLATSIGNFPQQMISEAGKPTIMIKQPGYSPVNGNQQDGAVTTTSQKENNPTYQNQFTALQPNTFYVSTLPAHPSQVFNGSHIREVSSQPQIIAGQTPGTMLNQPQLLCTILNQHQSGFQTVNPLQTGLSWAPSNQQHYQNPVIIYNPQTGIRMPMQLPLSAAPQPIPQTSFASAIVPPPLKKLCGKDSNGRWPGHENLKLKEQTKNSIGPPGPFGVCSFVSNPPMTSLHGHVNQIQPSTVAQQKFMAVYQTDPNQAQIVNDGTMFTGIETETVPLQTKISLSKNGSSRISQIRPILPNLPITTVHAHISQALSSTETQQKFISVYQTDSNQMQTVNGGTISTGKDTKAVSLQTKSCLHQKSKTIFPYSENSQACVAPTICISAVSTMPTLTITSSSGVSAPTAKTQLTTVDAYVNKGPSSPVAPQKIVANYPTNPNPEQIVNDEKMSIEIGSKLVSIENEISSPQKSQPNDTVLSDIPNAYLTLTSTEDNSTVSMASSPLNVESSTMSVKAKSSFQMDTFVSSVDTITSSVPTVASIDTITSNVPTVSFVNTITSSVPTVSSVDTIISSWPSVSPGLSLTDGVSFDLDSKPSLPKTHNKDVFTSDQTNSTDSVITTENLKPQQAIQRLNSHPVKGKKKAIVKPQVLTHVIDGFIIQESSEPFPVSQSALLDSPCRALSPDTLILPKAREVSSIVSDPEKKTIALRPRSIVELAMCAYCGHLGSHFRTKKKKRFCSKTCVKQFYKLNSKHVQISASSVQEHVGSGVHRRKRKKKKGRKGMEIGSHEEKENINTVIVIENSLTSVNELSASCKTGEKSSTPENKSTVTCKIGEENSAPENESTVSCKTGKNSVPENESTVSCKTREENSTPENEPALSYITGEDDSVPENKPAVSCITGDDYSEPASGCSDQTPVEVVKSNEVGKLKSNLLQKLPSKWTVQDVYEFIQNFPGCSDYAENFKSHEVDGQVLFLLNNDHLTTCLCMKLGPALKLLSHIRIMEEKLKSQLPDILIV